MYNMSDEDEILFEMFGISGYDYSANPNCDCIGDTSSHNPIDVPTVFPAVS